MDKAPAVLIANERVPRPAPAPRLRLLIEMEPRHRVFVGNLADLLLSRRVPPVRLTGRPVPFWKDVFVPSGVHWTSFLESMLLHILLVILVVWSQSRVWESVKLFPQPAVTHRAITYYPPKQSFRAAEARASSPRARSRVKQTLARKPEQPHQPAIPVRPEQKASLVTPPDIKQATANLPNLPGSHTVTPMVPFSATAGPRRNALAEPSAVVAPPPQVGQATARQLALPQASAVAPAPELGVPSAGRPLSAPNGGGVRVVPPPPSLGNPGAAGRVASLTGDGSPVVPPPPSVQSAGNSPTARRLASGLNSLSGERPNVVPPPPSVAGTGNGAGKARLGSMAGTGSDVVPPPPSVGTSGAGGRVASLSGEGSPVVAPPPSVEGAGNSARSGRMAALSGDGSPVAPPPAPVAAASIPASNIGGGGTGKILEPMDPLPTGAASDPAANNVSKPSEELPLGLLGVVFVPPASSFFSNFEVFVAKRRVGKDKDKDQIQLIKLVYEFLPYQRRLSEYNLNNLPARVIKLKVTPDPGCDESLGQMIAPSADPNGQAADPAKLPEALRSSDLNAVLPCYRTTATDFQKAMSRGH